jgi:tetratricopeptide (TPR) repeat protein
LTFTHYLLSKIYLAQGDPNQAVRAGQQALEIADDMGARPYQANAHQVLGQAFLALEQWDQARPHVETAWRIFGDLGDEEQAAAAKAALDALVESKGRTQ